MKFGVREICDVVLKAKANQKIGNKIFYKNEPVIYFDTLKTSSMEGAATTVYAQGGRGNARLMAWEGERTLTFTMEDALISPAGFAILSGAGLINGGTAEEEMIKVHTTETIEIGEKGIQVSAEPYTGKSGSTEDWIYVMVLDGNGNPNTEPFIYTKGTQDGTTKKWNLILKSNGYAVSDDVNEPKAGDVVLVDYYVARGSDTFQIDITPDKFGGYYYLEASTLFRDQDGVDMPAEFVIPKCKIQSNFTFTMASSGDPSTFTFTIDAFPDYTRFNKTEKVLASIQVISGNNNETVLSRETTNASASHYIDDNGIVRDSYPDSITKPTALDGDDE